LFPQPPGSVCNLALQAACVIVVLAAWAVGAEIIETTGKVIAVTMPARNRVRREIPEILAGLAAVTERSLNFSN